MALWGTFASIGGNEIVVENITVEYAFEPFNRVEFDKERLRNAPEDDGTKPLYSQLVGGVPVQIATTCADITARDLSPSDFDEVQKRFNITRYSVTSAPSSAAAVDAIGVIAAGHQIRLARFQSHIQRASLDIPYSELIAMQSEAFTFITSTGTSLTGPVSGSNLLITQFQGGLEFEIFDAFPTSASTLYKNCRIVMETRTISNLSAA